MTIPTVQAVPTSPTKLPFNLSSGWYVFFGVGAGVIASGTKAAPLILGVLSIALLYQLSQLVEGK